MSKTPQEVNGWEQLLLEEPAAVEIIVRCGLVPDTEHAQFQLEVRSATDGALILLESRPHAHFSEAVRFSEAFCRAFVEQVTARSGPFRDGIPQLR